MDSSSQYTDLCQNSFAYFVTALKASSDGGGYKTKSAYNQGPCGLTGTHTFKVHMVGTADSGGVNWQWQMDETAIGPVVTFPSSDTSFQRVNIEVFSEIVATDADLNTANNPQIGQNTYSPAAEFMDNAGNWQQPDHGNVVRNYNKNSCQFTVKSPSPDVMNIGMSYDFTNPPCLTDGTQLW